MNPNEGGKIVSFPSDRDPESCESKEKLWMKCFEKLGRIDETVRSKFKEGGDRKYIASIYKMLDEAEQALKSKR